MFTKKSDASKMEKEITEIKRLNDEAIKHGSYRITNSDHSHLLPIVMSNDCRDQII
jgi:hypothetical protein